MNDCDYFRAGRSDTSVEALYVLACNESLKIRARVAENPATPELLLQDLSRDRNEEVRIAVGRNPATPLRVILQLAFDQHDDVRYSLAENASTHLIILLCLANDENPYVSDRALKTMQRIALGGKSKVGQRSRKPAHG